MLSFNRTYAVPWRHGQARRFASMPRINWAHPLADGLIFYGYDTGNGVILDLVQGRKQKTQGTINPAATSQFGQSTLYANNGTRYFDSDAVIQNTTAALSFACALYLTANQSQFATAFGRSANNNVSQPFANYFYQCPTASSTQFKMQYATGAASNLSSNNTTLGLNTYSTLHTNLNASGFVMYVNGARFDSNTNIFVETNTNDPVCFSGNANNSAHQPLTAGYVYYGAIWNRTLTAAEAFVLHTDPYCFLWYPEDDIFAMIVGKVAATTVIWAPWLMDDIAQINATTRTTPY